MAGVTMVKSLGLGGDGDEVDAIQGVEAAFGVRLDYADAATWLTVGDVYASLLRVLKCEFGEQDAVWKRFCEAISSETGVDPLRVTPETKLLGPSIVETVHSFFGRRG